MLRLIGGVSVTKADDAVLDAPIGSRKLGLDQAADAASETYDASRKSHEACDSRVFPLPSTRPLQALDTGFLQIVTRAELPNITKRK